MDKDVIKVTNKHEVDSYNEYLEQIKLSFSSKEEKESELQSLADKMSLLVSDDDDLMQRYQENLVAFSKYHPEIYEFYKSYEPQRYVVDTTDGFVNAVDLKTGFHFYNYPSYLTTKLQYEEYIKKPAIKKFHFNVKDENNNEANFIHAELLDEFSILFNELETVKRGANKTLKKDLSSQIIFGVGAGYHVELFALNHQTSCLYLIEPDCDLFFLSFFSINWGLILSTLDKKGTRIHISLGEQKETFFNEFMQFSGNNGRYQMCHVGGYLHYVSEEINDILTEFNARYLEMGRGYGFFDDSVMSIGHTLTNIENNVPILKYDAMFDLNNKDVPVFIIGNGPSLDNSIDVIKKLKDKAIIISCGSAISALYKYGIKPDFHCEQERTYPVKDKLLLSCPESFFNGINFIAPTTVHPAVFKLFSHSIMVAKSDEPSSALLTRDELGQQLFRSYHFINPTVANTAICMGSAMGFKEFYFFGVDLGHKKGGSHHSKQSLYYADGEQDIGLYNTSNEDQINVEGNFGEQFVCDRFFKESNDNLTRLIHSRGNLLCFNLSDGAKVIGAKPLGEIDIIDMFDFKTTINKSMIIEYLFTDNCYVDSDGELLARMQEGVDFHGFSSICEELEQCINDSPSAINQASNELLKQTQILRESNDHLHDLLIGTVLHMQVMLTQLLYDAPCNEMSLNLYKKGMQTYKKFLGVAPSYYRKNALTPHYIENSAWISKLKEHSITKSL